MLNLLQIWRPVGGAQSLNASTVTSNMQSAFKDIDVGPFDVADKFFKAGPEPFEARLRHYFVDSSMTPLLVHENFLQVSVMTPQGGQWTKKKQEAYQLHRAALACDFIAAGDVVGTRILKEQQWGLAPLHGALSCIAPGVMMRGSLGRLQFPQLLGRNSTASKRARLLRELTCHMSGTISGSKTEVRQSYIPALRPQLLDSLAAHGANGVEKTLELLEEYSLSKDDFDSIMELELLVGVNAKSAFSTITTATKSALTRKYNAAHAEPKRKVQKGIGGEKAGPRFTEDGDEGEGDEDEDEDEGDADEFVPRAKTSAKETSAKGKGKGKAKVQY